jgi:hypothetical protein
MCTVEKVEVADLGLVATASDGPTRIRAKIGLFSRDHESSGQFVWLNRSHREIEAQLACSGTAPSIIADSSQDETM